MSNVMSIQERLAMIRAGKAKVEENEGKGAKIGDADWGKVSASPSDGSPERFDPCPAISTSTPPTTPQIDQMVKPTLAEKLAGLVSNNIANGDIGKTVQSMPKLVPTLIPDPRPEGISHAVKLHLAEASTACEHSELHAQQSNTLANDIEQLENEVDEYRQKLNRRDERIKQLEAIVQLDKVRRKDVEARLAKLEGML